MSSMSRPAAIGCSGCATAVWWRTSTSPTANRPTPPSAGPPACASERAAAANDLGNSCRRRRGMAYRTKGRQGLRAALAVGVVVAVVGSVLTIAVDILAVVIFLDATRFRAPAAPASTSFAIRDGQLLDASGH